MFSNDRLFSLYLTFPDLYQYPHIFHIFYEFLLNKSKVLLRKIALPYPHKCLFGFVEQKRIDRQEFFKDYSCHKR